MIKLKDQEQSIRRRFMNDIAIRTAPVLFDLKPSILLALHNDYEHIFGFNWYDAFSNHRYSIEKTLGLSTYILKNSPTCMQVLFYRESHMESSLHEKLNNRLLRKIGYKSETVMGLLAELKTRFKKESFPHEIGLFLGYPLKDVVGFMYNKEKTTYKGRGCWKIYGKVQPSINLMNKHRKAKRTVKRMIETNRFSHYQKRLCRNNARDTECLFQAPFN